MFTVARNLAIDSYRYRLSQARTRLAAALDLEDVP
jgi:hypothetical protein